MTATCPDCGRPAGDGHGQCAARARHWIAEEREECALLTVERLRTEVATLRKVVEAAKGMREQVYGCNGGNCDVEPGAFDAALADWEKLK